MYNANNSFYDQNTTAQKPSLDSLVENSQVSIKEKVTVRTMLIITVAFLTGFGLLAIYASSSIPIYHNTGDIYLDRSRPGYLPDEQEIEEEGEKQEEEYVFDRSGKITIDVIDEYLEKIQTEVRAIDAYSDPFDENALSNAKLGIPVEDQENESEK